MGIIPPPSWVIAPPLTKTVRSGSRTALRWMRGRLIGVDSTYAGAA
jgi:hypothetical protein